MKKLTGVLLGVSLLVGGIGTVAAQEMSGGARLPPKVLVILREFMKPGKSGMTHEKSESAFVQALTKAKSKDHYFAVDSLSGRPRSLFLFGYDSFADWEKVYFETQKDPALAAALDHAAFADGDLLSDMDATVATFREDQSLRAKVDISEYRYFEISLFQVKPGHRKDWDEIVKLVMAAYEEKIPDARWATFEVAYGQQPGGTYAIFSPLKSASEIDRGMAQGKDFVAAMGEDGMKKLAELEQKAIESSQTNLFAFNPKISYPPDEWVKSDPDFWKPKAASAKKAAEKPANPQ
jgi:hypothetical protein